LPRGVCRRQSRCRQTCSVLGNSCNVSFLKCFADHFHSLDAVKEVEGLRLVACHICFIGRDSSSMRQKFRSMLSALAPIPASRVQRH
jgi:hypothetical protein